MFDNRSELFQADLLASCLILPWKTCAFEFVLSKLQYLYVEFYLHTMLSPKISQAPEHQQERTTYKFPLWKPLYTALDPIPSTMCWEKSSKDSFHPQSAMATLPDPLELGFVAPWPS